MYISQNGHIGSTHAYRMQQRQRQKDEVVKLGGKRKWLAKSDRKEPLPLPLNGSLPLTIIECTKCSPSARTRVQISAHFHFLSHFRAFSARGETPEDEVLNASSQKELEWKICKKRIHRILFHMHGDTLIPFVSQKQSQSKRYKGHLAQLLVIFP